MSSLDTWSDFPPSTSDNKTTYMGTTDDSSYSGLMPAWSGTSLEAPMFGLSPSVIGGNSYNDIASWPAPLPCMRSNSDTSATYSSGSSFSMPLETPPDVPSYVHNQISTNTAAVHSVQSPPNADANLVGYHNNVAADHAHHLSDLVKSSTILGAGHPGPRSLASSLSRSVMSGSVCNQPNTSLEPIAEKMSIQQRRRFSQQNQVFHAPTTPDPSYSPHRRQQSAPDIPVPFSPRTPSKSSSARSRQNSALPSDGETFGSVPLSPSQNDEWTDTLLANSHDLIFVLSLKGTVLFISPSVTRILGFSPDELVGRPLVDFSHPADVGPFSRELKEAITLPGSDESSSSTQGPPSAKTDRRVDLVMRMACKSGGFCLIETTGKVSVDPPKQRKVVVCSGRPHAVPMLPWDDVRGDLMTSELSAWLKISHNGIFLGSTGPINQILGIEEVNLLGRHIRDLPMVTSSTDLLEALRCGRSISVQDHCDGSFHKAPVKLTVYPWTSNGRSNALAFVHVQQHPLGKPVALSSAPQLTGSLKRKSSSEPESASVNGSLSGSSLQSNGSSVPAMSANDAASTVFSELTGFHSGSWLIEMHKLHNTNRRLRHELSALRKSSPSSRIPNAIC